MAKRNLYRIYDGGDHWDYSAESSDSAAKKHLQINYVEAGVSVDETWGPSPPQRIPDNEMISVDDAGPNGDRITRTAREWADAEDGLVGTTCV